MLTHRSIPKADPRVLGIVALARWGRLAAFVFLTLWIVSSGPTYAIQGDLPDTKDWIEVQSGHFTLYSNASEKRTRKMAVQLERFRQALGMLTRGFELDSQVPTSMFVFRDDATYQPYKRKPNGDERNVSGYFLPRNYRNYITLDASSPESPFAVVYHEYFHSVMDNSLGDIPTWINEGIAEFFSTFQVRPGTTIVEVGHAIDHHLLHLGQHGLLDWDTFYSTTPESPTYNESERKGAFYAQAWLFVHYFNSNVERSVLLGQYLSMLRAGVDEETAFVEGFGESKAVVGNRIESWLTEGRGYVFFDLGETYGDVAISTRELTAAEIYYRLGDLIAQSGPREPAVRHLTAAREAEWNDGDIETSLGAAALFHDDLAAAEHHFDAAVTAGAESGEAHGTLARIRHNAYLKSDSADVFHATPPEELLAIRTLLEKTPAGARDHFETLILRASTYLEGRQDMAPGIAAIEKASLLRPLDMHMMQIRAGLLALDGLIEEAWQVVWNEIDPRRPELVNETEQWVVDGAVTAARWRLDDGKRAEAVTLLGAAVIGIRTADVLAKVQELHDQVAAGGQIFFADNPEDSDRQAARGVTIATYNSAVELARLTDFSGAIEVLEPLVRNCTEEDICASAKKMVRQLNEAIAEQRWIDKINEVVDMANSGDKVGAVTILRTMRDETKDAEKIANIETLLKQMGGRVPRRWR